MPSREDILRIAAEAAVDPRTVASHLAGGPTRPAIAERIERAIGKLGIVRGDVGDGTERKA